MWFDGIRQPNTIYAASVSRGKDSTAMLLAIEELGFPLDAIYAVDIWATQDIPAELPPMVAFKNEWDKKCLERFGIPVTRLCAMRGGRRLSYEDVFYKEIRGGGTDSRFEEGIGVPHSKREYHRVPCGRDSLVQFMPQAECSRIKGFPRTAIVGGLWCNDLKTINPLKFLDKPRERGAKTNIVQYIGIAADEPKRIERWQDRKDKVLPLVQIGWDEAKCRQIAEDLGMLAPTYTTGERDGCWFCHNQGIKQLRRLRKEYPGLWAKLLQWDTDSPTTFHADGRTVHDFDRRFQLEEEGLIDPNERFKWSMCEEPCRQMNIFDYIKGE